MQSLRKYILLQCSLLLLGFAAGSGRSARGSGSDYICLTDEARFLPGSELVAAAKVYGAQYQTLPNNHHKTACVVCQTRNKNVFMLPGSDKCPAGFDTEYMGYVATSAESEYRATHVCMDNANDRASGSTNGYSTVAQFHRAEVVCGALPCSIYPADKNLLCAVCSA